MKNLLKQSKNILKIKKIKNSPPTELKHRRGTLFTNLIEYEPKWVLPILVGFISGVFGGAVAIPGPPMILYGAFMASTGLFGQERK